MDKQPAGATVRVSAGGLLIHSGGTLHRFRISIGQRRRARVQACARACAEHKVIRPLAPPDFDPTLKRAQQLLWIGAWPVFLELFEELARSAPRLGFKPSPQLSRHRNERIGPATATFRFGFGWLVGRASPSRHAVRNPARN